MVARARGMGYSRGQVLVTPVAVPRPVNAVFLRPAGLFLWGMALHRKAGRTSTFVLLTSPTQCRSKRWNEVSKRRSNPR
jgi:hypothetical protein